MCFILSSHNPLFSIFFLYHSKDYHPMYFGNAESKLPEIQSIFYGAHDSAPLIFKVVIFWRLNYNFKVQYDSFLSSFAGKSPKMGKKIALNKDSLNLNEEFEFLCEFRLIDKKTQNFHESGWKLFRGNNQFKKIIKYWKEEVFSLKRGPNDKMVDASKKLGEWWSV